MSYVKLKVGGEERGLKFNQMAYILFYKHVDLVEYVATMHYAIVYAGLRANAYVKSEEFEHSFSDVCDWVDDMTGEDKEKAVEAFSSTQQWQSLIEQGKAAEETKPEQKKRTGKSTSKKV